MAVAASLLTDCRTRQIHITTVVGKKCHQDRRAEYVSAPVVDDRPELDQRLDRQLGHETL
jgi:hypothetical protein